MGYIRVTERIHMDLESTSDYKTKVTELYKLVLYGLIGY